jgi:hypothetical protein
MRTLGGHVFEKRNMIVRESNGATYRAALLLVSALFPAACGDSSNSGLSLGWGHAEVLAEAHETYGTLAGDGRGSAVMVWIPPDTADRGAAIAARRFDARTGWAPVETIAPPGANRFQTPVADMDGWGNIVVAWPHTTGLLASSLADGRGWSQPQRISREYPSFYSSFPGSPALGLAASGSGFALWNERSEVWSNQLDPTRAWGAPEVLWPGSGANVGPPVLAINANGAGLAAWTEGDDGAQRLWASVLNPRSGWAAPRRIGPEKPLFLYALVVALNDNEDGFVFWTQVELGTDQADIAFVSHYAATSGFGTPESLGRGGCQGAAVDSQGNGLAVQAQPPRTLVRRYTLGRGWEPAEALPALDGDGAALSMDAHGDAWILWLDWADGSYAVWSRRFTVTQGLGPPAEVAPRTSGNGRLLQVVADDQGGAVAAWFEVIPGPSATIRIRANHFEAR